MSRKKAIIFGSVLLFFTVIVFVLYFFFVLRAESSLQELVDRQSNGKLMLRVKKVKLDFFQLRFDFHQPELRTVDSSINSSGYHVKSRLISFQVKSFLPLLSGKQAVIDSVLIHSPLLEVVKYRSDEGPSRKLSIAGEMSKVYASMEQVLKVLNLNYLHINDAKFRIYDRSQAGLRPITVSNINLTIENVSNESTLSGKKFLFTDRILLEIFNENLMMPDGNKGISFKRLRISTRSQTVKLDSCYVYSKSSDSAAVKFNVFIDSLRINKLDFNALAKENIIKFDSAICVNPDISLVVHVKEPERKTKLSDFDSLNNDSIDVKLKKLLGDIDIGYLGVKNAKVKIQIEKNRKSNVFISQNDNFSLSDLVVNSKSNVPIHLGQFEISLKDYTRFSPDSMDIIRFDKIVVNEEKVRLENFSINPSGKKHSQLRRNMKMEVFEIDDIDWAALFYEHRIVAGHASLIKPEINLVFPQSGGGNTPEVKKNPFEVLEKLQDKVSIGTFFIENGSVKIEEVNGISLSVYDCFAEINVNQLLKSTDALRATDAVNAFSFSKGSFDNRSTKLMLEKGNYSGNSKTIYFGRIQETKRGLNSGITLRRIKLEGINLHSSSDISASKLSWQDADISINMLRNENDKAKSKETGIKTKFTLSKLQGGATLLYFIGDNIEASTQVNQITTDEIIIEPGRNPVINGLNIDGRLINLHQNKVQGNIGGFNIHDKNTSTIENVKVFLPLGNEMISLFIPRFVFSADINQSINGKLTASFIELQKPEISFLPQQTAAEIKQESGRGKLPLLNIGRLTVLQPKLSGLPGSVSDKLQFEPGNLNLNIIRINSDPESSKIDSITISAAKPFFKSDKLELNPTGKEKIDLSGSEFEFKPSAQQSKSKWSFNLNVLKLSGFQINTLKDDSIKQVIALNSLNLENLKLNDSSLKKPAVLISSNNHFLISNGNIGMENSKTRLGIYNLSLNKATNSLGLDSMSFSPFLDRNAFMATQEYQATHIQVHTGKVSGREIDFNLLLRDTVISLRKVTINDIHFLAYKDKRLPFHHGIYKPMLTDLLLNIKPKIQADSVIVKKGSIEYEEFNDKTQQFGHIKLNKIKGAIGGVRTFDPLPADSLKFNVYARLLDTAELRIKYKQSYTDSLSGFNLKLIVSSINLTTLNPMLLPFTSAELKSGYLDTLRMSVIGRKYVAYGVMKMYYSNLNAQLVRQGDSINKNFVTKSVSFLANRIVHSKNKRGIGHVYAERDPEKGFVNYWVKIVIGGVLTNTGVRSNKKQDRKYQKGVKFHDVPVIPDIPVDY